MIKEIHNVVNTYNQERTNNRGKQPVGESQNGVDIDDKSRQILDIGPKGDVRPGGDRMGSKPLEGTTQGRQALAESILPETIKYGLNLTKTGCIRLMYGQIHTSRAETEKMYDLSQESQTAMAEIMLQTNPIKFDEYEGIDWAILDMNVIPGTWRYAGIYLFGTEYDDNYFILGDSQVSNQVRNYRGNSFFSMKTPDIVQIIRLLIDYYYSISDYNFL